MHDADVIVIGCGGGGAVAAKELGELGLKVLVLEAGGWHGNKKWQKPNEERGEISSSDPGDLDVNLLKELRNKREHDMNDLTTGKFRWGPSDRNRAPWLRKKQQSGFIWQISGVGGTTQHYWGNSPRAYPDYINGKWPISYDELLPYYEKVEDILSINYAATTTKEEIFYYGAKKVGWSLLSTRDVTSPGYRPQPNAILRPNDKLTNPDYFMKDLANMEGCTLSGHCMNGCPHGPSVDKIAKRSTDVSYVPLALKTGNVTIRPNTFTTKILTGNDPKEGIRFHGVQFRDTWTGETGELFAKTVVLAGGAVETPRLWLNSGLPFNPWVGKGFTNHYFDWVTGIFDEKDLKSIVGSSSANPFIGNTSGARFDYPGLGGLLLTGLSPGLAAMLTFGYSQSGYDFLRESELGATWDHRGRIVGEQLKEFMGNYHRMIHVLISTDDEPNIQNGITVDPLVQDEHGPVPVLTYRPSKKDSKKRDELVKIGVEIFRKAGARKVIRSDWPAGFSLHLQSTMRMGFVVDACCEAYQVKRLYIADNSIHYNSLGGGPNPTLTTQALATLAAEKLVEKYFT
jgi:choline dehydrogenase-like flavoprotein